MCKTLKQINILLKWHNLTQKKKYWVGKIITFSKITDAIIILPPKHPFYYLRLNRKALDTIQNWRDNHMCVNLHRSGNLCVCVAGGGG